MSETATFPPVVGRSLEGRRFELPGGFEGRVNLVLVAFHPTHQAAVASWVPEAMRVEAEYPGVRHYELAVLDRGLRLVRAVIEGGMRAGIHRRDVRERTISVYADKRSFRHHLDIPDEDAVRALLVGRDGTVHWRARGPLTSAALEGFEAAVGDLVG